MAVLSMSTLAACATKSPPPSNLTLPAFQSSTQVAKGLYTLPFQKDPQSVPKTSIEGLTAYGVCAIDFNALRASKGLLGEAALAVETERDELEKAWNTFRIEWAKINKAEPKKKKRFGLF